MEIPPSKVFLAQKMMIRKANIAGKPVITATQMLESMISNPRPTRAECSDVANAVYDGSDCVMLSGETANGPYFEQAVKVMSRTCCEAESSRNYNALFQSIRNSTVAEYGHLTTGESLASSAVKTAIDVNAKLVVVLSETGTTARYVAKFRPPCHIICLTPDECVSRQSGGVLAGCHSFLVDSLEDSQALAVEVSIAAIKAGVAKEGDLMVVVAGKTFGHGAADQIRVEAIATHHWDENMGEAKSLGHLKAAFHIPGGAKRN
jgi:pyruvate kinase